MGAVAAFAMFQVLRVLLDVEFNLPLPFGGNFTLAIRPALDVTAIAIAASSLVLALLVFGLEPAIQLTRTLDVRSVLAEGAAGVTTVRAGRQRMLLRWQVAISAGFFIVATMFVRHTVAQARHEVWRRDGRAGRGRPERAHAGLGRGVGCGASSTLVMDEARKDPAVTSVAVSTGLPFGLPPVVRLALSSPEAAAGERQTLAATGIAATPSIFQTLGVPILRGRGFDDRDQADGPPVVVLSEFTARRIFGTADAVGRQLRVNGYGVRGRDGDGDRDCEEHRRRFHSGRATTVRLSAVYAALRSVPHDRRSCARRGRRAADPARVDAPRGSRSARGRLGPGSRGAVRLLRVLACGRDRRARRSAP